MVDKSNISSIDATPSEGVLTHLSALERRRFLFKSLGKGVGAGVALGVPLSGYASNDDGERKLAHRHKGQTSSELYHCSVSGMQSAIASRDLANISLAAGYSPGYWGQLDDDECVKIGGTEANPVYGPKMKQSFPALLSSYWSWTTPVKTVLSFSTMSTNVTLGKLMAVGDGRCEIDGNHNNRIYYGQYADKVEVHWICAILNAAVLYSSNPSANRFPYSASTIQNVANGSNTSIDRDRLYLLVTYLEGTGGL